MFRSELISVDMAYRQRASSYEDEDRYAVGNGVNGVAASTSNIYAKSSVNVNANGGTLGNGNPVVHGSNSHIYSAQDLHRFSQNADRFSTNVRANII